MLSMEVKHKSIVQLINMHKDADYIHLVNNFYIDIEHFYKIVEKLTNRDSDTVCFKERDAARIIY